MPRAFVDALPPILLISQEPRSSGNVKSYAEFERVWSKTAGTTPASHTTVPVAKYDLAVHIPTANFII